MTLLQLLNRRLEKIEKELNTCRTSVLQDGWQTMRFAKKSRKWDFLAQEKIRIKQLIEDMENLYIDFEGYRYWYEYKLAKNRIDICLATKDPTKYCNGFYLYSDKDPGTGKEFVVTKTNNPNYPGLNVSKNDIKVV